MTLSWETRELDVPAHLCRPRAWRRHQPGRDRTEPAFYGETCGMVEAVLPLPVVAGESLHHGCGVPELARAFDGVNLKLAKLGGPLQVMMGGPTESSLGTVAAHLAGRCDWADTGLNWAAGQLKRPAGPGWGMEWV